MLKPILLAAMLATVGGLSLQPALAQGHVTQSAQHASTVQSSALTAREPQGEHVPISSITYQATEASIDNTGNACVAQANGSGCAPVADYDAGFRDRNDVSRHAIENR
jgi:hypothetical protein